MELKKYFSLAVQLTSSLTVKYKQKLVINLHTGCITHFFASFAYILIPHDYSPWFIRPTPLVTSQTVLYDIRKDSAKLYSSFLWVLFKCTAVNIMLLLYSVYLKKVLEIISFASQTCITHNQYTAKVSTLSACGAATMGWWVSNGAFIFKGGHIQDVTFLDP